MLESIIEMGFWPEFLSVYSAIFLVFSSMFTAALTAAFGLGGGVIMLALLMNFMPLVSVIPVHGVVQLGSNVSRTLLLRQNIVKEIAIYYFIGAVVGAIIGGQFVVALPKEVLLSIVGVFILYTTWGPKPKNLNFGKLGNIFGGVIITFATMFIGATGPLAMALLPRKEMEPLDVSATHGALMVIQHGLKIIIFGFLGFAFKEWTIFLILMLIGGTIGSYSGRALLKKLPKAWFQKAITVILTLLALRMLYNAILIYMT